MNLTVEFTGMPATGKTAIFKQVKSILEDKGIYQPVDVKRWPWIKRQLLLSYNNLNLLLTRPVYSARALQGIISSKHISNYDLQIDLMAWLGSAASLHALKKIKGIQLMDQGVFQAFWQVGLGSRNPNLPGLIRQVKDKMEYPDMVILVEASQETIARRIAQRVPHGGRIDWRLASDPELAGKAIRLYEQIKVCILEETPASKKIKTLIIDNDTDTDLDTKVTRVTQFIENEWLATARQQL